MPDTHLKAVLILISCLSKAVEAVSSAKNYDVLPGTMVNTALVTSSAASLRHCAYMCSQTSVLEACQSATFNTDTQSCMLSRNGANETTYVGSSTEYITVVVKTACGNPPTTENGFYQILQYVAGGKAVLVCLPDYVADNVTLKEITCGTSQVWSAPMTTCIYSPVSSYEATMSYRGTSFAFGYMASKGSPTLYIVTSQSALVTLNVPYSAISEEIVLPGPGVITKTFDRALLSNVSGSILNKGISVTSDVPIMLYTANVKNHSADGTFVFPLTALGSEYITLGHHSTKNGKESFLVVGTAADTSVSVVSPNGVTTTYTIGKLDTFYQRGNGLAGTIIYASAPIYMLAGHSCANIPDNTVMYCDYIDETLPPIHSHGKVFVFSYMYDRSNFTLGFAATRNFTAVTVYDNLGTVHDTFNMSKGGVYYKTFTQFYSGSVISNEPILVTQYGHGSNSTEGDPSMMVIPAISSYGSERYDFTALSGYTTSLGVAIPEGKAAGLLLDGFIHLVTFAMVTVPWVGSYEIMYANVSAELHNLSHVDSSVKYTAWMYGRRSSEEIAMSLGMMT